MKIYIIIASLVGLIVVAWMLAAHHYGKTVPHWALKGTPLAQWNSSETAAAKSVEARLKSERKHWVRTTGKITEGAYVQDILEGRMNQPKGRGAIGRVASIITGTDGQPGAVVDFGRGYLPAINLHELSLVQVVSDGR